ncbi:unnamed protein product, partial [Meganyctiphanes norvegica]
FAYSSPTVLQETTSPVSFSGIMGQMFIPLVMLLVLGYKLPVSTLSQELIPAPNFCGFAIEKRSPKACVGPFCQRCNGNCKSRCGPDETLGLGYCGRGCQCCQPRIINSCLGKCTTRSGSGYCKATCGREEERLGSCKGRSCSCCRRKPINKPGGCPLLPVAPPQSSPFETITLPSGCQGDVECPGAQKCCAQGVCCSRSCMEPCDPIQPWCLG